MTAASRCLVCGWPTDVERTCCPAHGDLAAISREWSDFRKCDGCGSTIPVHETTPPSGFVDWTPIDAKAIRDEFETMLAVEREVITNLRRELDEERSMQRCNALSPNGDERVEGPYETYFCDLWPGHAGAHVNAAGVEWSPIRNRAIERGGKPSPRMPRGRAESA